MINTHKEELEKRIHHRAQTEGYGDYDQEAYRYGLLYLDTYRYMKEHGLLPPNLLLLDCSGLSIQETTQRLLEMILQHRKGCFYANHSSD